MILPTTEVYDKDFEDLMYTCSREMEIFCKTFMPESFPMPFSQGHKELFRALDDPKIQKLAIAAPRGFGKTSIFNKAFPIREIEFQNRKYIIPVSAGGDSAKEYSENLKNELMYNEDLVQVFGPIKSTDVTTPGPFNTIEWVTSTGIKVLPRGAGQQIRGRQFGNYRPDLFIIDDLENDEAVESEERRMKLKRWFLSALKNSIKLFDPNWRIVMIGTILHEDSLLANLLNPNKYTDWTKITLELCDDECNSKWPEAVPTETIKKMKEEYRQDGMLDIFYREYRNIPIPLEDQGFKPEYFKYYDYSEEFINSSNDWEGLVLSDPARTMSSGSCLTAIVGISINMSLNLILVREIVAKKMSPADVTEETLAMAARINAIVLAPEVTGLEDWIIHPLRDAMNKKGKNYIIVPIHPRGAKQSIKRSAGLIPLYKSGHILHNKVGCGKLEELLASWPRPSRWDEIDALANHISALEEGGRFFTVPTAGDDVEAEYAEIGYSEDELVFQSLT